ncbi:MAG: DNA polymerase I [Sandaracinaceae bacterium]
MAQKERLVLVDGSWLVFRAFFAIPSNLSTKAGLPTNAIYGFATMFRKLFAGRAPDRGAVVFDSPEPTFREQRFPEYKAQRPAMADDLRVQLPWIDRLVRTYRFPLLRKPGYEADDLIATLARRGAASGMDVLVVAGDKDLAQLVEDETAGGGRIRMQDTMRDVTYDEALVRKKWGVPAKAIPDLLAIMGDDVDNIPGVPGIGQKGAAALIEKYGSLEGILAHVGELKGKQKAALEEHADAVRTYRELATVDVAAALDVDLDDLVLHPPDRGEIDALHRELEFFSLIERGDEERASGEGGVETEVLARADEVARFLATIPDGAAIAIVPIFDPPDRPVHAALVGVALSFEEGRAAYVDARAEGTLTALGALLASPTRTKVVHDLKQLALVLAHGAPGLVFDATRALDTMVASFLVEPVKCIPHRLDQVAKEYVQRSVPTLKALTGSGPGERRLASVDRAAMARHAGELADVVRALGPVLAAKLDDVDLRRHYEEVERPLSLVLARMERHGIFVDPADLDRMGEEFRARKAEIEARIYALAGREFNIGSTKQLADVLFEELKLPVIKKTKTGYSTDAEVLERLAPKHEIAREILAQRELAKLINTYTDVLRGAIAKETGRIHASFQQTTGVSGRLISTDPDLQRTPVRTPEGKRIRRAFVAPVREDGTRTVIVSADWSQIELRVLAHFARDPALERAFAEGLDLHRQTASVLFGVSPEAVSPEQRNVGKTVNFATIYGQGATALGQILGIPRKDAQRYIEQYFEHYAGVRRWLDQTIEQAHRTGYVTTLLGRRRYIAELSSRNETDRAAGERIAANTPIQGSAADLCKLAMLAIDRALPGVAPGTRMLLQVHDELVFEAPEHEVEAASACIRRCMEAPYPLAVPLVVGLGVGPSWGDAK